MFEESLAEVKGIQLSILVPCLDEEDNVQITLEKIGTVLRESNVTDFEVVIICPIRRF